MINILNKRRKPVQYYAILYMERDYSIGITTQPAVRKIRGQSTLGLKYSRI